MDAELYNIWLTTGWGSILLFVFSSLVLSGLHGASHYKLNGGNYRLRDGLPLYDRASGGGSRRGRPFSVCPLLTKP